MPTQDSDMPINISWSRFAYSADMVDTDFGNIALPPKWRSSMAVYHYPVPKEQTAATYPNGHIVYLRLNCSITGWNLDEEIQATQNLIDVGDLPDDLQKSVFEAFSAGALAEYSPCTTARIHMSLHRQHPHVPGEDAQPVAGAQFDIQGAEIAGRPLLRPHVAQPGSHGGAAEE